MAGNYTKTNTQRVWNTMLANDAKNKQQLSIIDEEEEENKEQLAPPDEVSYHTVKS